MSGVQPGSDPLGRQLDLDEIFDLSLYRALRGVASGRLRDVLDELIQVETRHEGPLSIEPLRRGSGG